MKDDKSAKGYCAANYEEYQDYGSDQSDAFWFDMCVGVLMFIFAVGLPFFIFGVTIGFFIAKVI